MYWPLRSLNAKVNSMNKNRARNRKCRQCGKVFEAEASRVVFCGLLCRILSETSRFGGNSCWIWNGAQDKDGYGRLRWKWREMGAHVASWEVANGERVKLNQCILHTCDHPWCVNPAHLFSGTQKVNVADRHQKGRTRCNPNAGENGRRSPRNHLGQFKGMCGV